MKKLSINDMKIGQVIQIAPTRQKPPAKCKAEVKKWEREHYKAEIVEVIHDRNSIAVRNKDNDILYSVMCVVVSLDRKDITFTSIN